MSENGTIHITIMKNLVRHILFLRKGGANRIPGRGVPEYMQSTQLRTLIFEWLKNKNVLNRENAIKTCLTRVRTLYTNW